jgi:hypothetical protein
MSIVFTSSSPSGTFNAVSGIGNVMPSSLPSGVGLRRSFGMGVWLRCVSTERYTLSPRARAEWFRARMATASAAVVRDRVAFSVFQAT